MAQVQSTGGAGKQTPQQASQAALLAALAAQGSSISVQPQTVLASLQAGKVYTLLQVAQACGYKPRKRASTGKPVYGPLRNALRRLVHSGQVVATTIGGYTGPQGNVVGGKAYYMLVS